MRRAAPLAVLVIACGIRTARADEATIVVHADRIKGRVNRDLFGTEIKCDNGGQGLMTGLREGANDFRPAVMEPIERLGITFMRYKFMRHAWRWEDGIGPLSARPTDDARQKYMGIDECMAFQLRTVGDASKCHLVVNPRDPEQSAALVAYLNSTTGIWAARRTRNGHPAPYGVRWFELGNETYAKDAGFNGDPHAYCAFAARTAKAMKDVDPSVKCGINMEAYPMENPGWRDAVLREGGAFADYVVCHAYYPMTWPRLSEYTKRITNMRQPEIAELYYKMIMAGAHQGIADWRFLRGRMKRLTPRASEIALCLTENGFHLELEDAAAQNTVLVGVYDADELGMMVEHAAELKLENANLFYLDGDNPWAFIQHTFEHEDGGGITLRPPYAALFLWTHYFGNTLLTTEVRCGTFDIPLPAGDDWPKDGICWSRIAAQTGIPLLAAHASLSADGRTLYLVVINRDLRHVTEANIRIEGFAPQRQAALHALNTSVTASSTNLEEMFRAWDSGNEERPGTVGIADGRFAGAAGVFRYRFPAHSATALVMKAVND